MKYASILLLLVVWLLHQLCYAQFPKNQWTLPYIGTNVGHYEASVGLHVWPGYSALRNLQLRSLVYLTPGVRANAVFRSNREMRSIEKFEPCVDELFLEGLGFWNQDHHQFSVSLKAGAMRYLRFPYPDLISMFDQVPGIEDQQMNVATHYEGLMLTTEYNSPFWIGHHFTGLYGTLDRLSGYTTIENYLFFRTQFHMFEFESRWGNLQIRQQFLGASDLGISAYLGAQWQGYRVGFLYETITGRNVGTGILVEFSPSVVTEWMGTVHLDYTRSPQGVGFQIPFLKGFWGSTDKVPLNALLVGKITVERTITYWQNGQGRNFYEHIISIEGNTHPDQTTLVIKEYPWYLKIESLVSPHNQFTELENFLEWERKRQGPAQLAQKVEYLFYHN